MLRLSKEVLNAAISTPSTVPDNATFPVTVTPLEVTSNLVLPASCNLILPTPDALIIESVVL